MEDGHGQSISCNTMLERARTRADIALAMKLQKTVPIMDASGM
jgi:hypothetical protein